MTDWSIIIPALNEEAHIASCLESLCNLTYAKNAFEVIIVDNGSVDQTVPIAKSYTQSLNLTVLSCPGVTVAALRNAGAAVAVGSRFAFLDADCVAANTWLCIATQIFQKSPGSVIGAFYNVPENAGWPARIWQRHVSTQRRGLVNYIPASNILVQKELFSRIGGFETSLVSNEDSQFCAKAHAHGAEVLAFPELAITHLGAEKDLLAFIKRQFWHGSSVLNRAAFRNNRRAIGFATYTLVSLTWLLTACILGGKTWLIPLVATMSPSLALAVRSVRRGTSLKETPILMLLLLVYSVVRALALPVALLNCARWEVSENLGRAPN